MTKKEKPTIIEGEVVDKSKKPEPEKSASKKDGQFISERTVALIVIAAVVIAIVYFGYPYVSGWFAEKFETQQAATSSGQDDGEALLAKRLDRLEERLAALEQHRQETASHPGQYGALEGRVASLEEKILQFPSGEAWETAAEAPRVAELIQELAALKATLAELAESQPAVGPGFAAALAELAPPLYQSRPYAGQLEQVRVYILDMPVLDQATLAEPLNVLSKYANSGIVDISDLQQKFSTAVIEALRTEGVSAEAGWWERTWAKIKGQVVVRRSDGTGASTLEAVLVEAEDYLKAGEIKAALDLVSALPAQQSQAFDEWIAEAGQRIEALQAFEALATQVSKKSADGKASR